MKQTASQTGIVIKEIGSFFAGGRTVTLTGQPRRQLQVTGSGPTRIVDQNGDYITGQTYVQYVRQAAPASDTPVIFWHGGAMTGAVWETTPDGRPGWQSFFLRHGFDTYICDAMERGRAGWSPYPEIYRTAPIYRTQNEAWTLFRFGTADTYTSNPLTRTPHPHLRFPIDYMDQFCAQFVPRWMDHGAKTLDGYFDVLRRVGRPVWLIGHSQGGEFALHAAARHPEMFCGIVVIEPASAPLETGHAHKVPHLFVWGDYIENSPIWQSYRKHVDIYCDALLQSGGTAKILDLPVLGCSGNSHVPMVDNNCDEIADMILHWIKSERHD